MNTRFREWLKPLYTWDVLNLRCPEVIHPCINDKRQLLFFFFFNLFWPCHMACRILVSQPSIIKPGPW